jgi:hypothetical protein
MVWKPILMVRILRAPPSCSWMVQAARAGCRERSRKEASPPFWLPSLAALGLALFPSSAISLSAWIMVFVLSIAPLILALYY